MLRYAYVSYRAFFFKGSNMALGPTQLPTGALSLAVNRLGRHKANNSPQRSAKVTNACNYTSPAHIPSRQEQFHFATGRIQGLS